MNDIYKHALAEVHEYGVNMGWVHKGTDHCDLFETLTNMADLDDNDNLEDDIRPSFLVVWNGFATLLSVADKFRHTEEI
jgi:hypothetical protein